MAACVTPLYRSHGKGCCFDKFDCKSDLSTTSARIRPADGASTEEINVNTSSMLLCMAIPTPRYDHSSRTDPRGKAVPPLWDGRKSRPEAIVASAAQADDCGCYSITCVRSSASIFLKTPATMCYWLLQVLDWVRGHCSRRPSWPRILPDRTTGRLRRDHLQPSKPVRQRQWLYRQLPATCKPVQRANRVRRSRPVGLAGRQPLLITANARATQRGHKQGRRCVVSLINANSVERAQNNLPVDEFEDMRRTAYRDGQLACSPGAMRPSALKRIEQKGSR